MQSPNSKSQVEVELSWPMQKDELLGPLCTKRSTGCLLQGDVIAHELEMDNSRSNLIMENQAIVQKVYTQGGHLIEQWQGEEKGYIKLTIMND